MTHALLIALQITVGPNLQASASRPGVPHSETTIAADPNDARRLLACAMVPTGTVSYVSFDGGQSWSRGAELTGVPRANDPTCAYGRNGVAYVTHKYKETAGPSDIDRLAVHRSMDGGRSWGAMLRGPQTTDRPWLAIDQRLDRLYVGYNYHVHGEGTALTHPMGSDWLNAVALRGSSDGGQTWDSFALRALFGDAAEPQRLAGMGGAAVFADGTILVLYEHMVAAGSNARTGKLTIARSTLKVLRSTDRGDSFEPASTVAAIATSYNQPHTRGVTSALAVDPVRGRAYVVWADNSAGRTRIMISASVDQGVSWSPPVPVAEETSAGDNFMPTVAVNREGVVGVLWYDRRDNPNNRDYYVRFSASRDGGAAWLPSVRVSQEAYKAPPGDALGAGDTAGLAAGADGRFHALWIDNRTGTAQAWTAVIVIH